MVASFFWATSLRRTIRLFTILSLLGMTLLPSSLPSRAAKPSQLADGLSIPPRLPTSSSYPATPFHYSSLGAFTAPSGTTTFDTTNLTCGGAGAAQDISGLAVCVFDSLTIPAGSTVWGTGSRPLGILVRGSTVISGTLSSEAGVETTGAGGGSSPSGSYSAGGGGGFGGKGGNGGQGVYNWLICPSPAGTPGTGGVVYGDLNSAITGGSSGGSELSTPGGTGGGALFLYSGGSLTISSSGVVKANGRSGGSTGMPGGGSGGGITLVSEVFTNSGTIQANGANGASSPFSFCLGGGGGGGGGRILISSPSILQFGTCSASGGQGGDSSTDGQPGNSGQVTSDYSGSLYRITSLHLSKTLQFNGPAQPLHYSVAASNTGPGHAPSTHLTDYLPPELSGVTWTCSAISATCPAPGGSGNLNLTLSLPPSSVMTFTITATLSTITPTLVNIARIDPAWNVWDASLSDNTAEARLSLLFLPTVKR